MYCFFVISLKRGSHKFLKTFVFLPIGKYKDYIIISKEARREKTKITVGFGAIGGGSR